MKDKQEWDYIGIRVSKEFKEKVTNFINEANKVRVKEGQPLLTFTGLFCALFNKHLDEYGK